VHFQCTSEMPVDPAPLAYDKTLLWSSAVFELVSFSLEV
jgi:hypothetical protein